MSVESVRGTTVVIHFDNQRCIHSRHCVLDRPDVFVPNVAGEWIYPDRATPAEVLGTASFYEMFKLHPVGKYCVNVCTNISCMLCGGEGILSHLEKRLGIKVGESTADGRFYLKQEEECLAACNGAPMMMVNHVYFEHLTPAKVDQILDDHK